MERGCRNCMWLYHMVTYNPTAPCSECLDYNKWQTTKPTNADRIRAMPDEELAEFLGSIIHDYCQGTAEIEGAGYVITDWLDWLKQETET